jgi:hypothetical protein
LFAELLHLIALLLPALDRTRLRAACRATWTADKNYRLPRPLQRYLETLPWWLPLHLGTVASRRQWRANRHLFEPWIGLCDTPAFRLLDAERLVPTLTEGRLIFRARVYRHQGEPVRHFELELRHFFGLSFARFREGDDKDGDELCPKGRGENAGQCLLRGMPALAPGLWAYLHEQAVLPSRKLSKWRPPDDCFYVLSAKKSYEVISTFPEHVA